MNAHASLHGQLFASLLTGLPEKWEARARHSRKRAAIGGPGVHEWLRDAEALEYAAADLRIVLAFATERQCVSDTIAKAQAASSAFDETLALILASSVHLSPANDTPADSEAETLACFDVIQADRERVL